MSCQCAGKLKDFFGQGTSSSAPEEGATADVGTAEEDTTSTSSSSAAEPSATVVTKKEPINLDIDVKFASIPPMSVAEKRSGRDRLKAIDAEEGVKRRREEARNTLEGYIYKLRDLLGDDSSEAPFMKCSQASERKRISEKVDEAYSWLQEHGDDAETIQYIDHRTALEYVLAHFMSQDAP